MEMALSESHFGLLEHLKIPDASRILTEMYLSVTILQQKSLDEDWHFY